ncbi:MAG: DUF721 domain-containing protein [Prevotella sp.]|jgi:predicted nucleic acid-binding Zn ribbon protein|nr:DUF721 domain-containing protein [Prevotella sp.]MBQ9179050.1 DUF721 domain-containing protein [Prevotella sp.]MBQ9670470.1 DUF721 domain-containing protein [Prevotella sp.]MBR1527320.1 DUF721 domain-containing protein [Prevotella sp.]MDY6229862.1 DUF721 domain-containing protein [Prevotella sp.]
MFRKKVEHVGDILDSFLREEGLETPLLQRRIVREYENIAGAVVARYTAEKYIKNQILYVKITRPALRNDLSMMRSELVRRLNMAVGSYVISDIHFY